MNNLLATGLLRNAPRRRRQFLLLAAPLALGACGFKLRGAPDFAFNTIYVNASANSSLGNELKRNIASSGNVMVVTGDSGQIDKAQVVLVKTDT